ncbi:Alpha/beta hydrolase family protein [Mycobacterium europaeum]|uniref:Alpha/beta hydrolase family protein n=1 Tax=Mycobacterium europaeum TaxID=761804 RepID=A0A0U1DQW1_9MYCO|nr:hypothetical protein [Mycobacterium europaeum]CQD20025.1 Alpha/beta hydrolase family protein [Mycobacterium europaeum]
MTAPGEAHDIFEPSSDTESARASAANEGSNVCRAAALSSLLQEAITPMRQLAAEQRALGFSPLMIEAGGQLWRERDPLRQLDDVPLLPGDDLDGARVRRWAELNATANPRRAVGFLIAMLGSDLERESAAAAAALWRGLGLATRQLPPPGPSRLRLYERIYFDLDRGIRNVPGALPFPWWGDGGRGVFAGEQEDWEPERWQEIYTRLIFGSRLERDTSFETFVVTALARTRLEGALRSPDAVTRSLALAAVEFPEARERPTLQPPIEPPPTAPGALTLSTIIHGTWGWKGGWWRPGGTFHRYILDTHRPNLYNRGAKFSWSGAYSRSQRDLAVRDFTEWMNEVAPQGIQTLFGHSYGGEIAARATRAGNRIHELVLLSTPVTEHVAQASDGDVRIVDIRLRFDPVLAVAGTGQRLPARQKVTEVLLNRWRLDHGATHDEQVWRSEDVARRGRV